MTTLRYTGGVNNVPTTFQDTMTFIPDPEHPDKLDPEYRPPRVIIARVGEVWPGQVFDVPDECAEQFLRRSDIEEVEEPQDAAPVANAAPAKSRKSTGVTAE